jgi:hypothetical protein
MANAGRIQLMLELEAGSDPIIGRLRHAGGHGESVEFSGWIGLAGALQRALSSATEGRSTQGECSTSVQRTS